MSDRHLADATPGDTPTHGDVQQLIEAESGEGTQGIARRWQASNSSKVVLTSDATGVKISRDDGTTAPRQVIVDGTSAGGALTGTYPAPTLAPATLLELLPPGTIQAYVGATAPAGWWICNGQAISRAASPLLFALIGITYGAGDGSTTFNLPNLQGRVILGVSGIHPLSTGGGSETAPGPTHTHPGSHSHSLNGHSHPGGNHAHTMQGHTHTSAGHAHASANHKHHLNGHVHGSSGLGISGSTSANSGAGQSAGTGTSRADDPHTHGVGTLDVNGSTDGNSTDSESVTPADTGTTTPGLTGGPAAGVTDTSGVIGSYDTSGPSPSLTVGDSTAPASSYGATTVPTLPPFLVLTYLIRNG